MQFKDYARLYDLIYRDKNYSSETAYLLSLIPDQTSNPGTLLELGCGTGNYSREFAKRGFAVTGVDLSQEMVDIATNRNIPGCNFQRGDIRNYKLGTKFPLIVSLFHVFSYLNSDQDVRGFFSTAYEHLNEGGILAFDFWYGDGVLADPPGNRVKEVQDEALLLKRHSTSIHLKEENLVEVTFDFEATNKQNSEQQYFSELHRMRYFFDEEVTNLSCNKFTVLGKYGWMTKEVPNNKNWYALYILRKI